MEGAPASSSTFRARWLSTTAMLVLLVFLGSATFSRIPSAATSSVTLSLQNASVPSSQRHGEAPKAPEEPLQQKIAVDPASQDAYDAAMALLNEKFGDYAEKLFHVHVGEPPRDRPPLWLSEAALKSMAKALRRCKEEGEPFVVAVGGHSAAAAHGNLPKESYAMVAQRYLEPVFAAAGLELEVRAHAMGGQKSAPASFCTKCTYGADAHVITWDFGMTDGKETSLLSFFAKHAMEMPGRPTVLGGYRMGSKPMSRGDVFAGYARKGWPIGTFPNSCNEIVDLLPEKDVPDEGLPDWLHMLQDINKLAHRSSLDKYSDEAKAACQPKGIPGTAAWHPGYREHRLLGHLFSMPILKAFNEAFLTPSFDSLDVEAPKPAVMCRTPECAAQYECRNCLYPRSPKLGRDEWDIGSLIVQAQEPPLRERFGEAASSTWKTGCLFRGADSHNAPAPNCLGSRDGQGAIYEDVTQPETQYLLLKLPFEDAREAGYAYELSVVICEELCDWGSCEKTRERLENATLTFDGSHFVTSRQSFAWCREVTKKVDLGEDHAVLGIRNPRPGRSIKLNTVAWGLRASPLHP